MKSEELLKLREQALRLLKEEQLANFEENYLSIFQNELTVGLEQFLIYIYQVLNSSLYSNLNENLLQKNIEYQELDADGFKSFRHHAFEMYAIYLSRYKDCCVDKEETTFIMDKMNLQEFDDICCFTTPGILNHRYYFRKKDLMKKLNEDNFENCYDLFSYAELVLDGKGNLLRTQHHSGISFKIPMNLDNNLRTKK